MFWCNLLNQIPGDNSSTEGHNVRGTYWTIPDEKGKRLKEINRSKSQSMLKLFQNSEGTYFEEVYSTLKKHFKLGEGKNFIKRT